MKTTPYIRRKISLVAVAVFCYGTGVSPTLGQDQRSEPAVGVYHALKKFELSGASARVQNLTLKRDRLEMRFNGTFYFETPVGGQVRGAVFIGQGDFRALAPTEIERKRLRLILKTDSLESDFKTAVLRFTDDTFQIIGEGTSIQARPAPEALELAADFERRFLKEHGANVSSRLACSILNKEAPGFFIAQFDKGKRDRFTALLDHQGRIPTVTFRIDAGEKGLIFGRRRGVDEVWMAFHSQQDYERGLVEYSDKFDVVSTRHYELSVDVRDPGKIMKLKARMDLETRVDDLHAIPLRLNESLSERWSERLKKALRVSSVRLSDGTPVIAVQEDWEEGLTLYLPSPRAAEDNFSVVLELEGDYMYDPNTPHCYYPLSNNQWYPRHGNLKRSTFDMTFLHDKRYQVISGGVLVRHERVPGSESDMVTQWKIDSPVALATFAVGRFERHTEPWSGAGKEVTVEFYSLKKVSVKEDFVVAEMMNSLNFFQNLFGEYPYSRLGGVYHPRHFGQGFASMLLMPKADTASKHTYKFIAHETAHQWWGNVVGWRSYRDQWLSEGFAEYSAILYTGFRKDHKAKQDLIRRSRRSLKGLQGSGRLNDVGPLTLGHRVSTHKTRGAYKTLIYNKGALVLRMLHFLFTDTSTGSGQPFYDMMADFVNQNSNGWGSTENFIATVNEHFPRTYVARKYGIKDLNWFFQQWIYETHLPTYRMEYRLKTKSEGSVSLTGTLYQENAPEDWVMPLPVVFGFGDDENARATIWALGPATPIALELPRRAQKVELDPDHWVLSEKSTTRKSK